MPVRTGESPLERSPSAGVSRTGWRPLSSIRIMDSVRSVQSDKRFDPNVDIGRIDLIGS
jgi:hypothetical protein